MAFANIGNSTTQAIRGVTWDGSARTAGPSATNGTHIAAIYYVVGASHDGT